MLRAGISAAALVAAVSASAQDRRASFTVDAQRLDQAVLEIGRETGASIGLRDRSLAALPVRRVRGANSAAEALRKALKGSGARVREIAPNTFLIEREPPPARAAPPARPSPKPKPAAPVEAPPEAEIVVTATKQDTPIALYPGAVTVIDGSSVSLAQAARGTDALAERAPSLTTTHLGPGRNKLFIRGIADSSFTGPTQGTVGQYWGDTRISYSAPDPNLRLYDIRTIEILEGPQGTLYGAGALGGIVKIVPNPPELDHASGGVWGGAQIVHSGAPGADGGAWLNLPLAGDKLAVRALAYGGIDGGYIDDKGRGLEDVNQVRTAGGRAALRWKPLPDWSFDLNTTYQRIKGRDAQYADRSGDRLTRSSAIAQPFSDAFLLSEFVANGRIGDIELVSATGLVDQKVTETFDASIGPFTRAFGQVYRVRLLTTETRLSRRSADGAGWVVGVAAIDSMTRLERTLTFGTLPLVPTTFGVRNRVSELTAFGELTVAIMPWLRVTGGGRVTQSWRVGNEQNSRNGVDFPAGPRTSRNVLRALPSVAFVVEPLADVSMFARYQQSYRPGGFTLRGEAAQNFESDRLTAFEWGLRYRPDRARASVALTLAATRWSDIQADSIDPNGFPVTGNIGDGRILSAGLTGQWKLFKAFEVEGALYLNDSRVTRIAPGTNALEVRGPLPNVAKVTGRIALDYGIRLDSRWQLKLNAAMRYIGRSRLGVGPRLGRLQGNYFDSALEARIATDRIGLSLSLTNLLDSRGSRFALGSPFLPGGVDKIVPLQPRAIRIGFDLGF